MTSAAYTPEATRETFAGSALGPRLTFGGILKSERIKLTSLRSLRITILITLIAGIGLSWLSALAYTSQMRLDTIDASAIPSETLETFLLAVATFASPFLALIFGVLGVFAMSSEYSSGMILSTLAAVPKRTPMYAAKALVLALISGAVALALVLAGFGIATLYLPAAGGHIFSAIVVSGGLGTVAYLVLIALLGFGIASVLRSTAGGVAVVAGVTFVLPIGFQVLMLTDWKWVPVVADYLPMPLGGLLGQGLVEPSGNGPGYWTGLLAMAIWALVPMVCGYLLLKARDAK